MVAAHAAAQSAEDRRSLGSHATPPALARTLVELALDHLGRIPELIVDPSCGAGSFLLAAADALVGRGVPPAEVPRRLAGCDIDPVALDHCRTAIRSWAVGHGVLADAFVSDAVVADAVVSEVVGHAAVVGDGAECDATLVHVDPLRQVSPFHSRVDLVVGNPPFLAQRTSDTARSAQQRLELKRRFGMLGGYTDDAAVFMLVAADLLCDDAVMVLVEPQSVLSTRDSQEVRRRVLRDCDLVALWADDLRYFDAEVDVCAPVLRRRRSSPQDAGAARSAVNLHWGADGTLVGHGPGPEPGASWAPLLAAAMGVPVGPTPAPHAGPTGPAASSHHAGTGATVAPAGPRGSAASLRHAATLWEPASSPHPAGTISDVASVAAGFRDEFYALAAAALVDGEDGWSGAADRLVTVGMIDVCRLDDQSPRRLGGRRVSAPRLDVDALERGAPKVARWVQARRVPKVVVATQTKVIEAAADPTGTVIPVTPVLSVEPLAEPAPVPASGAVGPVGSVSPLDVWHLLAVLSAPPLAAAVARLHAGSGLSIGSFRVSATTLRSLPLPLDRSAWAEGASIAEAAQLAALDDAGLDEVPALLESLGATMIRAYGAPDDVLLQWWLGPVLQRHRR